MKIAINGFGRIGRLVFRLIEEDNYFDECPVLDETEKYADTNISDFLEVLANMPTLDIETKRSVRRKIISNKVLMK